MDAWQRDIDRAITHPSLEGGSTVSMLPVPVVRQTNAKAICRLLDSSDDESDDDAEGGCFACLANIAFASMQHSLVWGLAHLYYPKQGNFFAERGNTSPHSCGVRHCLRVTPCRPTPTLRFQGPHPTALLRFSPCGFKGLQHSNALLRFPNAPLLEGDSSHDTSAPVPTVLKTCNIAKPITPVHTPQTGLCKYFGFRSLSE